MVGRKKHRFRWNERRLLDEMVNFKRADGDPRLRVVPMRSRRLVPWLVSAGAPEGSNVTVPSPLPDG